MIDQYRRAFALQLGPVVLAALPERAGASGAEAKMAS